MREIQRSYAIDLRSRVLSDGFWLIESVRLTKGKRTSVNRATPHGPCPFGQFRRSAKRANMRTPTTARSKDYANTYAPHRRNDHHRRQHRSDGAQRQRQRQRQPSSHWRKGAEGRSRAPRISRRTYRTREPTWGGLSLKSLRIAGASLHTSST